MQNNQTYITQTLTQTIERGKKLLHLVLKMKPLVHQVFEELEIEISEGMSKFLARIKPKIENTKFENPEQAIKVLLLKGLLNILKKLVEEYQMSLSPKDQEFINQILETEEKSVQLEESKILTDKNKAIIEKDANDNIPNKNMEFKNQCNIL